MGVRGPEDCLAIYVMGGIDFLSLTACNNSYILSICAVVKVKIDNKAFVPILSLVFYNIVLVQKKWDSVYIVFSDVIVTRTIWVLSVRYRIQSCMDGI